MCYIELKNEKYETLEDLKRLLHYILRLDKTAEIVKSEYYNKYLGRLSASDDSQ